MMHRGERLHCRRSVRPSTTVASDSTGSSVGGTVELSFAAANSALASCRLRLWTGLPGQPLSRLQTATRSEPAKLRPAGGTNVSELSQRMFCTLADSENAVFLPAGIEGTLFHVLLMFSTLAESENAELRPAGIDGTLFQLLLIFNTPA